MVIAIKDLATGEVIGTMDSIPELEVEPQNLEVVGGIDLAAYSDFTAELKVDLSPLNELCLFPKCIFTNNFLKYHGIPMVRRKHLRRERSAFVIGGVKNGHRKDYRGSGGRG